MKPIDAAVLMMMGDYKQRFLAEYWQMKIRYERLREMVHKYRTNTLGFTPASPLIVFERQYYAIWDYLEAMEHRAEIEGIDLDENPFEDDENDKDDFVREIYREPPADPHACSGDDE